MGEGQALVFVDIETTGSSARTSRVLEVAALRYARGRVEKTLTTLLDPGVYVSSFITNLTGITNQDIFGAPKFEDVANELLALCADAVFVAHNVWFDYRFLDREFSRLGIDFAPPLACTVQLSRRLYPQYRSHRLDAVIERHRIHVADRHRALGDAQALVEFFEIAQNEHGHKLVFEKLAPKPPLSHQRAV